MAESYIALYSAPLVALMEAREHVAKTVLEVLATCADARGFCFPGDRFIAERAGYSDTTVGDALLRLEALNYIRVIYTYNPRRQREDRDIQISPYVISLVDPHAQDALLRWGQSYVRLNQINDHDPSDQESDQESEPESELPLKPDSDQSPQPPPIKSKTTFEEGDRGASRELGVSGNAERKPSQRESAEQTHTAQRAGNSLSAAAPASRAACEPRSLASYRAMLANHDAEQLAMNLVALAGDLSQPNARMLVDVYGQEAARDLMRLFTFQPAGTIVSPARWIRHMFRHYAEEEVSISQFLSPPVPHQAESISHTDDRREQQPY